MATIYLRSTDGSDSDNGSTWALAKATLAAAVTAADVGGTVYVSDNHTESQGSAMTITSPGTVGSPVIILCVDDSAEPPTALATTAAVATTTTFAMTFNGYAYSYGVTYSAGSGIVNASINFGTTSANGMGWIIEAGKIAIPGTGPVARINIGSSGASGGDILVKLTNSQVQFGNVQQGLVLKQCRFVWEKTASAIQGSVPTTLILPAVGGTFNAEFSGVDLSAAGSGKTLVSAAVALPSRVYMRNCKIGTSFAILTGAITGPAGIEVYMENCDSGDTNYRMEHDKYQGSIVSETVIVNNNGANDGSTGLSWKMATLAAGATFTSPLRSPPIYLWNDTDSGSKTITVEILHDSTVALKDNEVWLEVEKLGDGSYPLSSTISDRSANILTTAADQDSSIATWTSTGITDLNRQSLSVTFTPAEKGLFRGVVCLAKVTYTIYVDPLMTVVENP